MDTQRQRIKMGGGHLFFWMYVVLIFGWIRVCVCVFVYHICASMQRKG